ncbi:MAG: glycosyltransferase family 4 protein [Elusimicrobia bacterium]|nr:glycosyltransferase family 4 protein [Elusimicrobiota bacterium]
MDKTPLGGGAMVGVKLVQHWPQDGFELAVLGSGALPPRPGLEYAQIQTPTAAKHRGLVRLSEWDYGSFCREFEEGSTRWLLERRERFPPRETCVLVNDVSEGPDLAALSEAGYRIVSLWHVDVVDYFNKIYLKSWLSARTAAAGYERLRAMGASRILPDLLRLVFEKQRETVRLSRRLIVPSRAMSETLLDCYGCAVMTRGELARRISVLPWGMWRDPVSEDESQARARVLKDRYRIGTHTTTVMTLSRISPEKGIHLLIEALRLLEKKSFFQDRDCCLLLCGEAAFMQGSRYLEQVKETAARLSRVRVFFPGYLSPLEKQAHLSLADLFASPSIHDSYGLSIVEAMQAGRAVLASDHYGVRDLLRPSFGRKVAYPSLGEAPAALSAALEDILSQRRRLKAMGQAARLAAEGMPFEKAAAEVLRLSLEEEAFHEARL